MVRASLLVFAILLAGCQAAPPDKSSEPAVEIMAKTASEGVPAEYAGIRARYPGARPSGTEMIADGRKSYDAIHFITAEGKEMTVYFDITKYMGKL